MSFSSWIAHLTIKVAYMRSMDPPRETVSNVGGVAVGSNAFTEITR